MSHEIRPMMLDDLDFAVACTRAEGWLGETRQVFEDCLKYSPSGCFIADVEGQRAGLCIATAYRRHGFIGELIVVLEQRGRGLGSLLFNHAVSYLETRGIRCIALDGDTPGVPIYEKAGFRKVCRSLRFYGSLPASAHPLTRRMSPVDLAAVCRLDAELFGDDRSIFLRRKYECNPHLCFVAEQDGRLLGYLLAYPGDGVVSIGPWAALPELENPLALPESLAQVVAGVRLRIGVLENNLLAAKLLRQTPGLVEGESSWRMVLGGEEGPGNHNSLYAIGSAAKG